ncbi:TolC family protein [Mucilaginibacter myungsuensis]|uniref:Efflux transporter outer membrane subunit n=1 Tax=Mucilaginibacter myungsuensis TaxID=649104 RepID=A0A929KVK2_9SPHI|nr:efflux transporter outer membrane subunit [Mucilaginibacter myungsuensis]MBE9661947.1 efflux transporter outer membrane subunit [Mucilaginibacter myungsuensis]MDN3599620.1 efflux transporter outer membrane subunit [Mucilaginibacter myungsuensis]
MLNYRIKHKYKLFTALLLLTAAGCKYKAVVIKSDMAVPDTYTGGNDTTTIAAVPVNIFFNDAALRTLIDSALVRNFDRQSALQHLEMATANLRYTKTLMLPQVNAVATAAADKYGKYTMSGVGNFDTNLSGNIDDNQRVGTNPTPDYFVGLRASWEVDLWGKLNNQKKAAMARFLASKAGYKLITTELSAQIAISYYQLMGLDTEREIIRRNIVLQENALEIVKIQKSGGRATELAVQQFAAQLANTKGLGYGISQQITEAENQLNLLTGNFNKQIKRDTSIIALPMPQNVSAGIPAQLLLNRPDIRQAEFELTAFNADIRSARAAFFPSLTITPYVGYNSFKAALLFNPSSAVFGLIGGLTAPVLNRRKIKTDYEFKLAEARQALFQYQKTIVTGYQEVLNGIKGVENYSKYYELKQTEVAALKNAVSVANDLYVVGRASYLEVITAQRSVLDAELELANIKKNVFMNQIGLYRALGGGWR